MTTAASAHGHSGAGTVSLRQLREDPAYQAFWLLRIGFTAAPILFGLDKFFEVMVNWPIYLSSTFNDIVPGTASTAMYMVGFVEVLGGLLVAVKPRLGAPVVALWLAGIILNLLLIPDFYDIALRDFGLLLAALTLFRLASLYPDPVH